MTQLDPTEGQALTGDSAQAEPATSGPAMTDFYTEEPEPVDEEAGAEQPNPDDAAEDDTPVDEDTGDESDEAPEPATPAPASWNADDRAIFAKLPPEAQAVIQRREQERDNGARELSRKAAAAQQEAFNAANQQLGQIHGQLAQRYEEIAARFQPQPPDARLLHTGNPSDQLRYQQDRAAYDAAVAQQQELHRRADEHAAQAQAVEAQQQQAFQIEQQGILSEKLPDYYDAERGPALRRQLTQIGAELGYPQELMAEATAADILALNKAAEWRRDADKWRAYEKSRRNGNGTFKAARAIAPVKPGVSRTTAPPVDPLKTLYPND